MRITYRNRDVRAYWEDRWAALPADQTLANPAVYPLKYAELVLADDVARARPVLEAGCGAGRVLRYYHARGYSIHGMDFVDAVIEKLRAADASLQVEAGDITSLRYADASFGTVLAFGLLHNLQPPALGQAVAEIRRVLMPGGRVCASFRADNIQNWLNDLVYEIKRSGLLALLHRRRRGGGVPQNESDRRGVCRPVRGCRLCGRVRAAG